jgi:hypothetical protein
MATNAAIQAFGAGALPPPGRGGIDPAKAAAARIARDQDVPITAPMLTPKSIYNNPESIRLASDAVQRNIIRELGENPETGSAVTANRFTPDMMTRARTATSATFDDIARNNSINPSESSALLGRLNGIEADLNNVTGVTPGDLRIMRQRINDVRDAIRNNNGQMPGDAYQGLTQHKSSLSNLAADGNPGVANIGNRIIDATRDAFENSLSQEDRGRHQQARYRWRLLNAVEPVAAKARGEALDMGALADSIYNQSQHLDTGAGSFAYTGGRQLGDFMSQARMIGDANPTPSPTFTGAVTSPRTATSTAINPQLAIPVNLLHSALDKLMGGVARSNYRADQVINSTMMRDTRLQQALRTLGAAVQP